MQIHAHIADRSFQMELVKPSLHSSSDSVDEGAKPRRSSGSSSATSSISDVGMEEGEMYNPFADDENRLETYNICHDRRLSVNEHAQVTYETMAWIPRQKLCSSYCQDGTSVVADFGMTAESLKRHQARVLYNRHVGEKMLACEGKIPQKTMS